MQTRTLFLFVMFVVLLGYAVFTYYQKINAEKNAINNQIYECEKMAYNDCQNLIAELNAPLK